MNLNTNNPLLMAAISGGGAGAAATAAMGGTPVASDGPGGIFFRRAIAGANAGMGSFGGVDDEDEDADDPFGGGSIGPNGAYVPNPRGAVGPNASAAAMAASMYHHQGPVPSPGTDKDFVWGFILGFFVGLIMILWVWMLMVPHKQRITIISGIIFQLGLILWRKSGGQGVVIWGGYVW